MLKTIRLARLALALTPLCLGAAALTAPTPVCAASSATPTEGLPPGAPPLTPAQRQQQQARIQSFIAARNALIRNTQLTPAQKQQQYQALQARFQQDMLNILTPAQQAAVKQQNTKILSLRKQFAQQHASEFSRLRQLTAQLAAANTAINKALTPQQRQKVSAIQTQARQQLQALQAQSSAPAVKQQTAQAIVRDAQRQAFLVLTPAQQAQLKGVQTQLVALQAQLGQELTAFAKAHGQQ